MSRPPARGRWAGRYPSSLEQIVQNKKAKVPPFSEVSEKKQQRARTLFKSVPEAQRAKAWSEKPARKALEPQSRTGLEPRRYSPVELVQAMVADGILLDLQGAPCESQSCRQWGARETPVLGKLGASKNGRTPGQDIDLHNVCYRSFVAINFVSLNDCTCSSLCPRNPLMHLTTSTLRWCKAQAFLLLRLALISKTKKGLRSEGLLMIDLHSCFFW